MNSNSVPQHPGAILAQKCLKNKSQAELSRDLGVSRQFINMLVNEKRDITPGLASSLESVGEEDYDFWMGAQEDWDSWLASSEGKAVARQEKASYELKRLESVKQETLVNQDIINVLETGLIDIDPFSDEQLRSIGYDLRLGKIIGRQRVKSYSLKAGRAQTVESLEEIRFSNQFFGRFGAIRENLRSYLIVDCGFHFEPGEAGHVSFLVENKSQKDILIEEGMPLARLEICFLPKTPSKVLE